MVGRLFGRSQDRRLSLPAKCIGLKEFFERVAAILEVKLDDLFCEAGRLPPDLRGDIKAVFTLYRRSRDARNSNNK
jgi:hypothetical protein